ncbi:MAG: glycerate kinase [Aristaeellaceae bacterium]
MTLRQEMETIVEHAIRRVLPDEAVRRALADMAFPTGRLYVVAAGKAAWQMARTACEVLGNRLEAGVVCTKYGHVMGELPNITCYEGGHPVPDENSFQGTRAAIALARQLRAEDKLIFLLSGGGSALFELPLLPLDELQDVTRQMLNCGADIVEINTIRKRLSAVKGGKFAQLCAPASVYTVVLSDVLGDPLDMIASGPTYPDASTCADALRIAEKYGLRLSRRARALLETETPGTLTNIETVVTGSVSGLCRAAQEACEALGYETVLLTDRLCCQAKEAGAFMAAIAQTHAGGNRRRAFIAGGETTVIVTGDGKGGRNQELALSAAVGIAGLHDTALFSIGSDGTDGPTDAAGGFVDGDSCARLRAAGIDVHEALRRNDAYHALQAVDGLIVTCPTGTNVNDVAVLLLR